MCCHCIIGLGITLSAQIKVTLADLEEYLNIPYADILEMPIFAFLKYWIYRTL